MDLSSFVTHYYEADYGPFLNICDLDDTRAADLIRSEKDAPTAFNRFAIGSDFLKWRRAADDLLIRAYTEKFGHSPPGRPFFALLGSFDKTLTMFRNGRKIVIDVAAFQEHELTFMYPDHAHLTSFYNSDAPPLFYQIPEDRADQPHWGRLFTYRELIGQYRLLEIDAMIHRHKERGGWAGCYVEAHLWRPELRENWRRESTAGNSSV